MELSDDKHGISVFKERINNAFNYDQGSEVFLG
jgi:hypothetical protein